jgi:uncharacterized protein (DUF427 family)
MARAVWNGTTLADSNWCTLVDGIHYFPYDSIRWEYMKRSSRPPSNTWIGSACYFSVTVNGKTNHDAAWSYRAPVEHLEHIRDHFAFWKGVQIVK